MVGVLRSGRTALAALVGLTGTALVAGAVALHLAAGTGVPADAVRAISVQLPVTAMGLLLAIHRPRNRLGMLALVAAALLASTLLAAGLLRYIASGHDVPAALGHGAFAVVLLLGWPLTAVWLFAVLTFPEGKAPSRTVATWAWSAVALHGAAGVGSYLTASRSDLPRYLRGLDLDFAGPFPGPAHGVLAAISNTLLLAVPAGGVAALVVWRRRSGRVARQQLRWLLPALALQLVVHMAVPTTADPWHGWRAVGELAVLAAPALGTAAVAVAVFRYRLWELDAVISKALVFAVLSAAVTAVFVVVAFGSALMVGGADGPVVAALTVVLAAIVVSQGPRRQAERAVRRVVFGDRPQGFAVLGGLGDSLASAGAVTDVAGRVVDAVRRGLSVPWAAVWLYVDGDARSSLLPVATDGRAADPLVLPSEAGAALASAPRAGRVDDLAEPLASVLRSLTAGEPAAMAPLVAGAEVVGLVACGDRFRDPLGDGDLELLGLVAREAALGLVNRRLETELHLRLAELRRSRQRLVTTQDAERRRVERDLHDGAQAQLVSLAAQIRRMAATPDRVTPSTLSVLAAEAEEAMIALQDLARGIYPSVLTDRGLAAAVRAQAARMPIDIDLRVASALVDRRLPADTEAALYFVALEALGNAQKHAAGARVTTQLWIDDGAAVLEVEDDGPGFDASTLSGAGSGLCNMTDRMEAIGGALTVRSTLGAGSCVSAVAPLPSDWLPTG